MSINYNITDSTYEKLMFAICKEYDEKLNRISKITEYLPEGRYELPKTPNEKTTLKMGQIVAYIKKPPGDIFDIEYRVEYKINAQNFIDFINLYLKKHYYFKFDFNNFTYKDEFLNMLAKYIYEKYHMHTKIWQNKGYIQFDITVWMQPETRIIYIN